MLQILGLRDGGHAFFEKGIRAPDVKSLLASPGRYLDALTDEERVNIYFTVHDCKGDSPRDFTWQEVLPFDVDDVPKDKAEAVARVFCESIGVDYYKTGVLYSGHGVQLFVQLDNKIKSTKYFTEFRELYKLVCQEAQAAIVTAGLSGKVDTSVFSAKRLMRMPETWNRKPHKGDDAWAHVLQPHMEEQGFRLETACGTPEVSSKDVVHRDAWAKFPEPDTAGVLEGCEFIKWAKDNQSSVSEPQWYALCGLIGFLPDGEKLIHDYSNKHKMYSPSETDFKVKQARNTSGPRTCKSIEVLWNGCNTCPNYEKCTTPLQIQTEEYIGTESTGFYKVVMTEGGKVQRIPDYKGLAKYYKKIEGPYFTCSESEGIYTYDRDKHHWKRKYPLDLKSFSYTNFDPEPRSKVVNEFYSTFINTNVKSSLWMDKSCERKLNLLNGVLDMENMELLEHSSGYGFMSVLPYEYNREARAPVFEKFMSDICCGDEDMVRLLIEFMGYVLSGDACWIHKALILHGDGSNGKSTFNKVLKAMVGPDYYTSLSTTALKFEQNRSLLVGKLLNIGDENDPEGMLSSEVFKALISGDEFTSKEVYQKPVVRKNKAKMIFSCNELPKIRDLSDGMFRRLIIVPFDAVFSHEEGNIDPRIDEKLEAELPGILNLCIKGYRNLLARGKFIEPQKSLDSVEEFKQDIDCVFQFAQARILLDKGGFVSSQEAYNAFVDFCKTNNERYIPSKVSFGKGITKYLKSTLGKEYTSSNRRVEYTKEEDLISRSRVMRGYGDIKIISGH
jgi:P4 family phage/plasmid primase-like protien